jgi:hypothetical protein
MKTKEFNLEMFKNGAKAKTKLGNPARFITVANNGKLIVAVIPRWKAEESVQYNLNGKKYNGTDTMYDLEMVEPYKVAA